MPTLAPPRETHIPATSLVRSAAAPAIAVRDLGKCYRIYDRPQDRLKQALRLRGKQYFREFWALRGVNLEVRRGEMTGIVGRNGSGKSTLLQLICGILTPTCGSIEVQGRVAALLELGAGFNPEFTGRENVFMNGAILGLTHAEVAERFDEIVAFSELRDFIDRPVKTYSSGMFVRLAFAVATSCQPDILIVDEALAVGDEAFQRKCFSRLERLRERGGTVLFVSHSAATVLQLCNSAFLLDQGELLLSGGPRKVITAYHKLIHSPPEWTKQAREEIARGRSIAAGREGASDAVPAPDVARESSHSLQAGYDPHLKSKSCTEYSASGAQISQAGISTLTGEPVNQLVPREEYVLRYKVQFQKPCVGVRYGTMIKSIAGLDLGGFATAASEGEPVSAGDVADVAIRFRCLLPPGVYFMNAGVRGTVDAEELYLHRLVDALAFRVLSDGQERLQGMFDFQMQPHVDLRSAGSNASSSLARGADR